MIFNCSSKMLLSLRALEFVSGPDASRQIRKEFEGINVNPTLITEKDFLEFRVLDE